MSTQTKSSGIGFLGLLALIFITLKLTGFIGWSWWWVLSPVLIPWAIIIVLLIIVGVLALIVKLRK